MQTKKTLQRATRQEKIQQLKHTQTQKHTYKTHGYILTDTHSNTIDSHTQTAHSHTYKQTHTRATIDHKHKHTHTHTHKHTHTLTHLHNK